MKLNLLDQNSMTLCLAREQLMEDIITIIDGYDSKDSLENLSAVLCEAVCKNFPLDPGPT